MDVENITKYSGLWVFAEHRDHSLQNGTLELVGEAKRIADRFGKQLSVIALGNLPDEMVSLLGRYGARRVLCLHHFAAQLKSIEMHSNIISAAVKIGIPEVLLFVDSTYGNDLACRVAAHLEVGLATSCDRLDLDADKLLVGIRPIYGSKAAMTCILPSSNPQIATVNPNSLDLKTPGKDNAEMIDFPVEIELPPAVTQMVDFIHGDPHKIPLTEAEIVVSGGRGMGSKQNFKLVHELADAIGGSVGASRCAVDEDWAVPERQVGLTGKTVRPRVYIACGISGAIQHIMGMKESAAIVAINLDRNAPIFKIADVSILGDVLTVMPVLTARLKREMASVTSPTVNDFLKSAGKITGLYNNNQ